MLDSIWHWYITVAACNTPCDKDRTVALSAIAGVAVVIWTGGLVSYQLKRYSLERSTGLDLAQTAFMFSLAALFMQPLSLRIALSAFFLFYFVSSLYFVLVKYRNADWVTDKMRKRYPSIDGAGWLNVSRLNRNYSLSILAGLPHFAWGIAYPYQDGIVWIALICVFLSFQVLMYHFNNAEDNDGWLKGIFDLHTMSNESLTTIGLQIVGLSQQLSATSQQLVAMLQRLE
jgi:hypothetical protein